MKEKALNGIRKTITVIAMLVFMISICSADDNILISSIACLLSLGWLWFVSKNYEEDFD